MQQKVKDQEILGYREMESNNMCRYGTESRKDKVGKWKTAEIKQKRV